ncbi:hypothetical protein KHA80_22315 [Anaerobacillus sp. HL2]|nr:hypothetical protein KHA80_22315 [Anaerobacillus sp. HL2]
MYFILFRERIDGNEIVHLLMFCCFISACYIFGLGPVLLADGSTEERIATLGVVIVIYIILTLPLMKWIKCK